MKTKRLQRVAWPNIGEGKFLIGVVMHDGKARPVVSTYSRRYALAVIRKWRRRGYTEFIVEAIQED